jgi:hypothetical protein
MQFRPVWGVRLKAAVMLSVRPATRHRGEAMKRLLGLLGVSLLAIFALGAMASAMASATEAGLLYLEKAEKVPFTFTATGGQGELVVGSNSFKCSALTSKGESSEKKHVILGTGSITFTGCKLEKGKVLTACNTEGAAKETIVVPIDFHLFNALEGTKLQAGLAVLILNPPLKVKCAAGTTIVESKGWMFGLILTTNLTSDVEKVEVHFFAAGETCDTGETFCENVKKNKELLEENLNGKFEPAQLIQLASLTFNQGMLVDD